MTESVCIVQMSKKHFQNLQNSDSVIDVVKPQTEMALPHAYMGCPTCVQAPVC